MATPQELDRLTAAIHELRPDWPARSLHTYLTTRHASRAYADLTIALTIVAVDPQSKTPKRVEESGPWWVAAQAAFTGRHNTVPHVGPGNTRCTVYGHEHYPAHNCPGCRTEALTRPQYPDTTHIPDPRAAAAGADR